ncbi:MAG TPA: hypothetical protein VGV37_15215 [Aliidongia sp.]|uniref:hypothetical protein n=1 Tax=Aliidongia sp. TaxID=1914230 RepID=UPI002DDDB250|nr:hypothetical protein [Aliidongia sp.]HEV2675870.1 hypothetical protein [Aliidongia sp.]
MAQPDRDFLPTDEDQPSIDQEEIREKSGGGRPASDVTNVHLSGTGAVETEDGLDENAEMVRHAAEDMPEEPNPYLAEADEEPELDDDGEAIDPVAGEPRDEPVFDRAETLKRPI